jgi:hypothetical protein
VNQSGVAEDEVTPILVFEGQRHGFVLGIWDEGRRVVDVIGLLVGRTYDNRP